MLSRKLRTLRSSKEFQISLILDISTQTGYVETIIYFSVNFDLFFYFFKCVFSCIASRNNAIQSPEMPVDHLFLSISLHNPPASTKAFILTVLKDLKIQGLPRLRHGLHVNLLTSTVKYVLRQYHLVQQYQNSRFK